MSPRNGGPDTLPASPTAVAAALARTGGGGRGAVHGARTVPMAGALGQSSSHPADTMRIVAESERFYSNQNRTHSPVAAEGAFKHPTLWAQQVLVERALYRPPPKGGHFRAVFLRPRAFEPFARLRCPVASTARWSMTGRPPSARSTSCTRPVVTRKPGNVPSGLLLRRAGRVQGYSRAEYIGDRRCKR